MDGELSGHFVGHLADNLMALAHAPADGGDDGFVIALCFQIAEVSRRDSGVGGVVCTARPGWR